MIDVAIIGGGAAGFFAAINIKISQPNCRVVIFEKTSKLLSKVKVSGGGRCNVTHHCLSSNELTNYYPRGGKFLKPLFREFGVPQTIEWFESKGVPLKTESDGRMFPISNSSETIIHLFEQKARELKIEVQINTQISDIEVLNDENVKISFANGLLPEISKFIVLATGGMNKNDSANYLKKLDLKFVNGVPSLFTFNIQNKNLTELAGISVPFGKVKIAGLKQLYEGPILITHWGLSGPAILKSSAWYARDLFDRLYQFDSLISWIDYRAENEVLLFIENSIANNPKKQIQNFNIFELPQRLWNFILEQAKVDFSKKTIELKKVEINRILENTIRMPFQVSGKTTFKDEFVTAGGIDLNELNPNELNLRKYNRIYAVGEMLDIDGVTGGFNFQAAWTTGFISAQSICSKL